MCSARGHLLGWLMHLLLWSMNFCSGSLTRNTDLNVQKNGFPHESKENWKNEVEPCEKMLEDRLWANSVTGGAEATKQKLPSLPQKCLESHTHPMNNE